MTAESKNPTPRARRLRIGLAGGLLILTVPLLAFLFDPLAINDQDRAWLAARAVLRPLVPAALFFAVALAIILVAGRTRLAGLWRETAASYDGRAPLAAGFALFAVLCVATLALNRMAGPAPWGAFALWLAGVGAMTGAFALAAAPTRFWLMLVRREWPGMAFAAGAAAFVTAAAQLSRQSWNALSDATFAVSSFILTLYERDVVSEPARRILGAGGFKVNIAAACSGYEGVGMVTAFIAIYLWFFRGALRFPNAWLLLPAGAATIWLFNAARIAMLISLGAHVSPEVALTGFHSQAGWLMFLIVTISLMLISSRMRFFMKDVAAPANSPAAARQAAGLLFPFLALTAAGLLMAMFAATGGAYYGLKITAGAAALFMFRRTYKIADWKGSWESAALGAGVGAVWILTDPASGASAETGALLAALPAGAAALGVAARIFGFALIVPLAEELAFRGYLWRKLQARRFEDAPPAAFAWRAFVISSALFGAMHERWLAGAFAGAVFALALCRTGRIGGAIWAHAVANLVIAAYAIAFRKWGLL